MDPRNLKKIVEIMNQNDLAEVEIEEEGKRLRVRKKETHYHGVPVPPPPQGSPPPAPAAAPASGDAADDAPDADLEGMHVIKAPMVGTFYRSPAPDSDPYADVGMRVSSESVVCILEAMKVMNEIKAECSGEIVRVCVQNGEAVEYDQDLFVVKTS